MIANFGPWAPVPPSELAQLMGAVKAPWWLAGGWALDSFLGLVTREYSDSDALILRRDHVDVREDLAEWDAHAADPPGTLRPWRVGEHLPKEVHDVWLRRRPDLPWAFQFMIDDTDGGDWLYRRDPRIRRPLAALSGPTSSPVCQVLAPEIQLLYKSKGLRPKDESDFAAVLPELDEPRRAWLRDALRLTSPDHPWLGAL